MFNLLLSDVSKKKNHLNVLFIIWFSIIWIVSSLPGSSIPKVDNFNIDKIYHIFMYLVLGYIVFKNYYKVIFGCLSKHQVLLIFIMLAGLDEAHQYIITNRDVSILDFASNVLGLLIGFFLVNPRRRISD